MKNRYLKLVVFCVSLTAAVSAFAGSGSTKSNGGYLSGYASKSYTVRFFSHTEARVSLHSVGYQNVDMYVYDQYGRLRCHDSSYANKFTCRFVPRRTGWHTIKVVNRGPRYVRYGIATN
jgi:hypothetical protein